MRQVRVVLTCDEGFVAETMRNIATMIEDEEQSWYEAEHGSGFTEEIEVPDPEPSLADIFDQKAGQVADERERERQRKQKMLEDEREYIRETAEKLAFLRERGCKVSTYNGGIVDGRPYTYVRIEKGGRWVEIKGSTVRSTNGTVYHLSPYIYNTEVLTMEGLVKRIAEW